jgi:GNAT superfamily N-acetyltransferase
MQIVEYTIEDKYVAGYTELIKNIYETYSLFAKSKIHEVERMLNKDNPFLRFGIWRNFLIKEEGNPVAHISTIIDKRLPSDVGLLGYFDTVNETLYADKAFDVAIEFLTKNQRKIIRGPVNLTTWQGFRVSYPERNPPFLLESFTRSYYRDLFENYGFKAAQKNISTIQKINQTNFDKYEPEYKNLKEQGFVFDTVDNKNLLSSLREIYSLIIGTFRDSWSFVRISLEEFIYNFLYFKTSASLLYIARDKNKKAVAFFLGALDAYSGNYKRIILKTMGVLPEYQRLGIAHALFYLVYLKGKEENASEFIFSTMRTDNEAIRDITGRTHHIYREYNVYEMAI